MSAFESASCVFTPLPSVSVANEISAKLMILVPWKSLFIVNEILTTSEPPAGIFAIGDNNSAVPSPSISLQAASANVNPAGM